MKPLSGMWLYINLAFAIVWDTVGFVLFIIGLIPAIQAFAVAASPVIDVLAFLTDLIFCILYQGYVKIYNANFKLYQIKRIREMMRLSKNSGAAGKNPIAQNLARQTQKINQYMLDKFSNYVINFTVKKIQYSITTSVIELVPWLGDFSPTWTIKANLHLREHKATARELRIKNIEFENSLAKWRGSLRVGGRRRLKSRNNIQSAPTKIKIPKNSSNSSSGKYVVSRTNVKSNNMQSTRNNLSNNNIRYEQGQRDISQAANNIRPLRGGVSGDISQSVQGQKDNNPDIMKTAANNIRPFRRKLPGEVGQSIPIQKDNKLASVKSGVRKTAFMGGQLVRSLPQSGEYEDEELNYRKPVNKNNPSFKTKVLSDISSPLQSPQNNSISKNNEKSPANNIKKFTRTPQNQVSSERILIKK